MKQQAADHEQISVLIVGAGLAGLMAARALGQAGYQVVVLERGYEVGGRLATERLVNGYADTGAQFFTARTPQFQAWVDTWLDEGLVYQWAQGWSDGSQATPTIDGHPRFAVRGGMAALARRLAQDLDIRHDATVTAVVATDHGWQVQDEDGRSYQCHALLLTPPAPASVALLDANHISLVDADREALARITFTPCLCGLFGVEGAVRLPEPGVLQRPDASISWIADNRRKGIAEATLVTVQAGPAYSTWLWPAADGEVLEALKVGLRPHLATNAAIVEARLKRWRHALPTTLHPNRYLRARDLPPLVFAGDAFGGPRVEGAALSGLAAALALAEI